MNIPDLRKRLHDPATRTDAAFEAAAWFRDLCLTFDCEVKTAAHIYAFVAMGLQSDYEEREQEPA